MIDLIVHAVPVAQPRQRHALIAGHVRNYTPTHSPVNVYKQACVEAIWQVLKKPLTGPIELWLTFVFPRPKSITRKKGPNIREWKPHKPDWDNLGKSTCDALNGVAWVDDCQIVDAHVRTVVAAGDELPHVRISFREIPESERP